MKQFTEEDVKLASSLLKKGKIIAFPTDTIYALACDATNSNAIEQLFTLKGRDTTKAMAVLTYCIDDITNFAEISPRNKKILEHCLPGPYSFVLPHKAGEISQLIVNQTTNTIGIRIPNHQFCLALLKEFKGPIVATSANLSGQQHAILGNEVEMVFGNKISAIFGTSSSAGLASTVIDLSQKQIKILREGVISRDSFLNLISDLL